MCVIVKAIGFDGNPYRVYSGQRPIVAGLKKATKALKQDVVRIVYRLGDDWVGQPSIFFNVALTDAAADFDGLEFI